MIPSDFNTSIWSEVTCSETRCRGSLATGEALAACALPARCAAVPKPAARLEGDWTVPRRWAGLRGELKPRPAAED